MTGLTPTRATGEELLTAFAPRMGRRYANGRNTDHGPNAHKAVSVLSPYIRRRLVLEADAVSMALSAHGPENSTTTCQLHMRKFEDGDSITVEPFRAKAFPVVKDLVVNRSAFDKIIQAGGFITVRTGSAPDGNAMPVPKEDADLAMDAAQCIGCGACVASCKNASAMLFTSAKAGHLNMLPQGQAEKDSRVLNMVAAMDEAGFGNCRNYGECSAACPKDISLDYIAKLNRDYGKAKIKKVFS